MALNAEVLTSYKKIDEAYIDELLKKEIEKNNKKIVVLDDDPTGVQTVHDISVYTNWEKDTIRQGFDEENNLFYVLTNSRGFTAEQTTKAHNEIAAVVDEVAKETGKEYIFISRSDSTLRGHYPLETELLKKNYEANTGKTIDGEILCPFFKEGGRYTIDNVHYVKYGKAENRKATGDNSGNQGYVVDGIDYSAVFDADYYYAHHKDVANAFGNDKQALFNHFMNYGIYEGRQASEEFNVDVYKANNADLVNAFGDDTRTYYIHYIKYGKAENRKSH